MKMTKTKFFKIVNPKGHNGMVYKEGLNVDVLPFNPSGDCEAGGIYFSSSDIFAFMDYGTELYEVEPVGEVYKNPGYPVKFKAHSVKLKYVGKRDEPKTIKYLVEVGANVHADNDDALRWAAESGHTETVKYLVEAGAIVKILVEAGANVHAGDDYALRHAASNGYTEIVKYLKSLDK
jgi:hypothetical protein